MLSSIDRIGAKDHFVVVIGGIPREGARSGSRLSSRARRRAAPTTRDLAWTGWWLGYCSTARSATDRRGKDKCSWFCRRVSAGVVFCAFPVVKTADRRSFVVVHFASLSVFVARDDSEGPTATESPAACGSGYSDATEDGRGSTPWPPSYSRPAGARPSAADKNFRMPWTRTGADQPRSAERPA
jgi:hypothetical protein